MFRAASGSLVTGVYKWLLSPPLPHAPSTPRTLTLVNSLIAPFSLSPPVDRGYINPKANGKDIIRISRHVILGFGVFMGVMAIILFKIGLSLGWV